MLLKGIRILCCAAVLAVIIAGISHQYLTKEKAMDKTNAVLVMAREDCYEN